jgi:hypothetical protein
MRDDRADQRGGSNSMLRTFELVWQLSDICSDPARFVSRQQTGGGTSTGLRLEINVSQRLTVVVADDEATAVMFFDVPRWREAARCGHRLSRVLRWPTRCGPRRRAE